MGLLNLFKKERQSPLPSNNSSPPPFEWDTSKWTGKDFEFLITGDLDITVENHDQIMTPNSLEWIKIEKDGWPYYQVDQDEFSYSWEPTDIQMMFNDEITLKRLKI